MKQENGNYICQCSGVSNDTVSCDTINVITKAQRIFYIENGYLVVENILSTEKLEKQNCWIYKTFVNLEPDIFD